MLANTPKVIGGRREVTAIEALAEKEREKQMKKAAKKEAKEAKVRVHFPTDKNR